MKRIILVLWLLCPAIASVPASVGADTSYAGQERRTIKALSPEDIEDLLAGRGWGFAKPAELNGFPGPAHVLELAERLGLSEGQVAEITALFDSMQRNAIALGAEYVAAERALDAAFSEGTVDADTLAGLVQRAAELKGRLRLVHLETHLEALPLLSKHQIATYRRLRGYDASGDARKHHH